MILDSILSLLLQNKMNQNIMIVLMTIKDIFFQSTFVDGYLTNRQMIHTQHLSYHRSGWCFLKFGQKTQASLSACLLVPAPLTQSHNKHIPLTSERLLLYNPVIRRVVNPLKYIQYDGDHQSHINIIDLCHTEHIFLYYCVFESVLKENKADMIFIYLVLKQ